MCVLCGGGYYSSAQMTKFSATFVSGGCSAINIVSNNRGGLHRSCSSKQNAKWKSLTMDKDNNIFI